MNKLELQKMANEVRKGIVTGVHAAKAGHPGGSLSAADLFTYLYFEEMNVDPKNPQNPDRDRFVLSKGHTAPGLYATLAHKGYFPVEDLVTLRHIGSHLQGHPCMQHTPGLDMSSGSLGQGISAAVGMALSAKLRNKSYRVYTLLGDGEIQEGQVWEAAMFAGARKLDNLVVIVPLISMLVIFGLFDGMTQRGQWQKFFAIFGGLIVLTGVVSVFLIPEPKLEPRRDNGLKNLVYGLRPSVVRGNPALYLSFAAFCLFSVAVQVFFPYLIIYMQNYLHFDGYALVLGIVLIFASVVSVLSGRVIDRLGELRCVLPAAGVMFAGLLGMFFARSMLAVILTGCIMMSGYMLVTAILSGVIRDHTPAGKAGHFQGIRMIFGVLLPMIFGPAIGAAVIRGSDSTYVDLGVVKTVPTPSIFLAAAIVLLLILPPVLALKKKEGTKC